MRTLITVPSLAREFGGPASKIMGLAEALRARGNEVAVVGCGERAGAVGLPVLAHFHATPVPRSLTPLLGLARGAEVVHVTGYRDPVGTAAALVAARAGVPVVFEPMGMAQVHSRSVGLKRAFDACIGRKILDVAAVFVATSEVERRGLLAFGVDPTRIWVRPDGVDAASFLPLPERGALRARLGILPHVPVVLTLARIAGNKGLTVLARALSQVPEMVAIVSGPDERDGTSMDLERLRVELGLGERLVVIPGGMWGSERSQSFADADLFCLPSEVESFGLAAAEGAIAGLPVVVSDGVGVTPWLDATATQVFAPGSADSLARALRSCLQTQVRESALRAAEGVRRRLDWSSLAELQERIYERAIGASRS